MIQVVDYIAGAVVFVVMGSTEAVGPDVKAEEQVEMVGEAHTV